MADLRQRRADGAQDRHACAGAPLQGTRLELEKRFAGQFTEAYVRVPTRLAKGAIHAFNRFYFAHIGRPGPALSNLLVFRKRT